MSFFSHSRFMANNLIVKEVRFKVPHFDDSIY